MRSQEDEETYIVQDGRGLLSLVNLVRRLMHCKVRHVLVERDILTATKTSWLVRLLYAFQDTQHVYLAMEYVPGGDFRTLLNNSGVLKEEHARFYISEMFVAVNELHKLGYIHRDLKPEVIMCRMCGLRGADTAHRISLWTVPATLN
jgi:cell cycle protein kinase DBF2